MLVSRAQLERSLALLRAAVPDPRAGLFGPGSASWRVNRESAVFLAAGRAALLQLAHPFVAEAIAQRSRTREDVAGRFRGTFEAVYAMAFGDLDHAIEAARKVHAIHERVHGTLPERVGAYRRGARFAANEPHALLWVHATLVDSALLAYERFVGALPGAERERYYQESKRFALLFGLTAAALPADAAAFDAYMRRTLASGALRVGPRAAEMAAFILEPPRPALAPALGALRLITAALLPERLRDELHFRFGARERLAYRGLALAIRAAYRALPRRVRFLPAYLDAERRLRGERSRDPLGRALDEGLIWLLRRPAAARG